MSTETNLDTDELLNLCTKDWGLSNAQRIAETNTSHVYKVNIEKEVVILKLLKAIGAVDEKNAGAALRYFSGQGAIKVLKYDSQALLLEYADGSNLKHLVQEGQDSQATEIIAEVLNKLHRQPSPIPTEMFTSLETWFRSLFKKSQTDKEKGTASFYTEAAIIAQNLLNEPREICILHGDIHHENVINSSKRGWLAIDPKGLYGERTFDVANTLCNPSGMEDLVVNEDRLLRNAEILSRALKLDMQRLLKFTFAYTALSASWSLEDEQNPGVACRLGAIIAPHINCKAELDKGFDVVNAPEMSRNTALDHVPNAY